MIETFTPFIAYLSAVLISVIWQGALLTLCMVACLRLIPRFTAAARSALWMALYLVVVLLPILPAAHAAHSSFSHAPLHLGSLWAVALASVWGILSLVRAVQLLRSALYLRGVARRAVPIDTSWPLHTRRAAEVCVSTEVDIPSVAGFFNPRILLPASLLDRVTQDELQQILLHEAEHLRRRDDWSNLVQKLALVIFPLNPVLFWVERRLCAERELACDDGVLQATGARKAYALCLTNLAEGSLMRRSLSLALGAWERQSELGRRVQRILRRPERPLPMRHSYILGGALLVGVLGGALELTRTPQLVAFTNAVAPAATSSLAVTQPVPQPSHELPASSASTPRQTLVSAVMPRQPLRATPAVLRKARRPRTTLTAAVDRTQRPQGETLVGWQQQTTERGMMLTVYREVLPETSAQFSQPRYAAIPTRNGWLIFEL